MVLCCVRFRSTTWWFRVHHTGEMILVFTDNPEVDSCGLARCSVLIPSTMLQCVLLRPNTASLLYVRDRIGEKISGLGSASTTKVCSVISQPFIKPMINACIFSAACRVVLRCWCYSRKLAPRGKCGAALHGLRGAEGPRRLRMQQHPSQPHHQSSPRVCIIPNAATLSILQIWFHC